MPSEEMVAEINSAITESLEAEKEVGDSPEGKEEKPETGEFDVSIVGDMEPEGKADEGIAADGERETEGGEEAKETEKGKAAEETDEVDDRSVSEAIAHGMSVTEARSFKSDNQLQNTINIIKEQNRQALLDDDDVERNELKPLTLPELDPEKYDKEVIESFRALIDEANRNRVDLAEFRENQGQVNVATQQAAEAELTRWFDRKLSDLGDGFHASVGEGLTGSLAEGSKELATRDAIASQMSILHDGNVSQGRDTPNIDDLFDTATRIVLHKEFMEIGEQKLKGKLEKRSGQIINRANRSGGSEKVSPEQETANILTEKFDL